MRPNTFFGYQYLKHSFLYALAILCAIIIHIPGKLYAQNQAQALDNGIFSAPINFPASNCTYKWTNDNPSIGLTASGSGSIAPFKTINNGIAPVAATITATIPSTVTYGYRYNTATKTYVLVDLNTLQDVRTIDLPNATYRGVDPTGIHFYMTTTADPNVIHLVDLSTGKSTRTVRGSRPIGELIQNADGSKIYTYDPSNDGKSGVISVLNMVTKTEEAPITIPANLIPPGVTASPKFLLSRDGTKLYLLCDFGNDNGRIAVISTATGNVISSGTAGRPNGLIESLDGTKLYAMTASFKRVYIYDQVTGVVNTINITEDSRQMALSQDGKKLYACGVFTVSIIDLPTNTVSLLNHGQSGESWLVMDEYTENNNIYVLEFHTGNIMVIDGNDGSLTSMIKVEMAKTLGVRDAAESRMVISSDGKRAYMNSYVSDLVEQTQSIMFAVVDLTENKVIEKKKIPSALNLNTYRVKQACTANTITVKITVHPDPPTITPSVTTLTKRSTEYGTVSTAATFSVSGKRINNGILVSPPAGFEVSLNGTTYSPTVTVPGTGDISATTVHVRLAANTNVGNSYAGNIILNNGTLNVNIAIPASNVTPAPLALAAKDVPKKYGTKLEDATGSTAFTPTGLKNGETIGSVSVKYGIGASADATVRPYNGSVTISAPVGGTFLATNYMAPSLTPANIIVEPAELTVTADDKQRYFGDDNPIFTFKYSGFVPGEDETQLTTQPTASTMATLASPLGNYPIILSGGVAANYKITYKAGILSIISRMITPVTAFTPNGDGINDTWSIPNITQYPKCTVEVFSRSGSLVFQNIGYTKAWDGRYAQTDLPAGTYYYIIKLGNGAKPITGTLAMIR